MRQKSSTLLRILIWSAACLAALILLAVTAGTMYQRGVLDALASVTRGFYTSRGDADLLDETHYPYPFLKAGVERHNITDREEIDRYVCGYAEKERVDQWVHYYFDLGLWGTSCVSFLYDEEGHLVRMDECGASVRLE